MFQLHTFQSTKYNQYFTPNQNNINQQQFLTENKYHLKMHCSLVNTEIHDEQYEHSFNKAPSFAFTNNQRSREDIYIHRLQNFITEHSKTIKSNQPIIEQLEYQRKFFKRICEKQKQKIKSIDAALIRQEYQRQMNELKQKRNKLHDMVVNLHDEAEHKKNIFLDTMRELEAANMFLTESLNKLKIENNEIQSILDKKRQILRMDKIKLEQNAKLLKQKQKVEQKYNFVLAQIKKQEIKNQ